MTEQDIINGCLHANALCQKALYDRFSAKMYAVCLRYARQREDASDILQEGFIKVFTKLDQYNNDGSFEGWVRKIMVNTALRQYQRQRFENERHGYETLPETEVQPDALSNLSEKEMLEMVHSLPEGYRMVFNLVAIEGYSHQEAGNMLEIQESTSRSQLTKARRLLAKAVDKARNHIALND